MKKCLTFILLSSLLSQSILAGLLPDLIMGHYQLTVDSAVFAKKAGTELFEATVSKTSAINTYEKICNVELNLSNANPITNTQWGGMCEVIKKSEVCKGIDKEDLLDCSSAKSNEIDFISFGFIKDCLWGVWKSLKELFLFVWDALKWIGKTAIDSEYRDKQIETIRKYYDMAMNYFAVEYEKARDDGYGKYEAGGVVAKEVFNSILSTLGDIIGKEFYKFGCYNRDSKGENLCKLVADIFAPPAFAIALIKKGPALLKSSGKFAKYFSNSLKEKVKRNKTAETNLDEKDTPQKNKSGPTEKPMILQEDQKVVEKSKSIELSVDKLVRGEKEIAIEKTLTGAPGTDRLVYSDSNSGKNYLVKTYPRDRLYRSDADEGASQLAELLGLDSHVPVQKARIEGRESSVIELVDGELPKDLWDITERGGDYSKISKQTADQLAQEQVFDWLLSNHDSHAGNFLFDSNGLLKGIDKAKSFKYFLKKGDQGALETRDSLSVLFNPSSKFNGGGDSHAPVYNKFFQQLQKGEIDNYSLEEAFAKAQGVFEKLDSISDDDYKKIFKPFAERFAGSSDAPKGISSEDILNKVLERKKTARSDFEEFYNQLQIGSKKRESAKSILDGNSKDFLDTGEIDAEFVAVSTKENIPSDIKVDIKERIVSKKKDGKELVKVSYSAADKESVRVLEEAEALRRAINLNLDDVYINESKVKSTEALEQAPKGSSSRDAIAKALENEQNKNPNKEKPTLGRKLSIVAKELKPFAYRKVSAVLPSQLKQKIENRTLSVSVKYDKSQRADIIFTANSQKKLSVDDLRNQEESKKKLIKAMEELKGVSARTGVEFNLSLSNFVRSEGGNWKIIDTRSKKSSFPFSSTNINPKSYVEANGQLEVRNKFYDNKDKKSLGNYLQRLKSGKELTDVELDEFTRFVNDSSKVTKEVRNILIDLLPLRNKTTLTVRRINSDLDIGMDDFITKEVKRSGIRGAELEMSLQRVSKFSKRFQVVYIIL